MKVKMTNKQFRDHVANVRSEDEAIWAAQGWVRVPDAEPQPEKEPRTKPEKVKDKK